MRLKILILSLLERGKLRNWFWNIYRWINYASA